MKLLEWARNHPVLTIILTILILAGITDIVRAWRG